MTLEFTESYLNRLARMKTPSNAAKCLLRDGDDKETREKLSHLIVKLGVGVH